MDDFPELIVGHYERHALELEADRRNDGWSDRPWHDRFVSLLPSGATVLDLGCGGGFPVASKTVACGLRVTGIDTSPALISLCRERIPDQEWSVADMRPLSLGHRFNGILAWDSFLHLSHEAQRGMFRLFADHSVPGTVLMFNAGPAHGEAIGDYRGDPLYHASLDSPSIGRCSPRQASGRRPHVGRPDDRGSHRVAGRGPDRGPGPEDYTRRFASSA